MAGAPEGNTNAAKGRRMSARLIKRLEERETWDQLADVLLDKALGGDITAIKEVFDRVDGKSPQAITTEDGSGFKVIIQGKDAII